MSLRSRLWTIATNAYPAYLRLVYKMSLGKGVRIAYRAHLDKSINPRGIHIGDRTWVLNGAFVMAHDHCRHLKADTYIGSDCVIGINAIIMPGLHIGNQVIIGGGAWLQRIFLIIASPLVILPKSSRRASKCTTDKS